MAVKSIELMYTVADKRAVLGKSNMDVERLSQAMSNALRHTPERGFINWTIYMDDHELSVCLKDSGPGFNPQELDKAFRKFYRGDVSPSPTLQLWEGRWWNSTYRFSYHRKLTSKNVDMASSKQNIGT